MLNRRDGVFCYVFVIKGIIMKNVMTIENVEDFEEWMMNKPTAWLMDNLIIFDVMNGRELKFKFTFEIVYGDHYVEFVTLDGERVGYWRGFSKEQVEDYWQYCNERFIIQVPLSWEE